MHSERAWRTLPGAQLLCVKNQESIHIIYFFSFVFRRWFESVPNLIMFCYLNWWWSMNLFCYGKFMPKAPNASFDSFLQMSKSKTGLWRAWDNIYDPRLCYFISLLHSRTHRPKRYIFCGMCPVVLNLFSVCIFYVI